MALVSVIMTYYNETVEQLHRSVYSILNQTLQEFEYIIVIGNPDNLASNTFISELKDARIKVISLQEKTRMTNCLNMAIKLAACKYIALQEADDESLPGRLENQLTFMENNPEVDIVGTSITYIDDYSKEVLAVRDYPEIPTKTFNKYSAIAHPTVFAKRDLYEKFGYYLETDEYRNCPDYELWLRWITQGVQFRNLKQALFNYYQTKDNGRNKNAKKTLQSVIRLKSKYKKTLMFSQNDHFYLFLEKCIVLLPQSWISNLFYFWVKLERSK